MLRSCETPSGQLSRKLVFEMRAFWLMIEVEIGAIPPAADSSAHLGCSSEMPCLNFATFLGQLT